MGESGSKMAAQQAAKREGLTAGTGGVGLFTTATPMPPRQLAVIPLSQVAVLPLVAGSIPRPQTPYL
jgi:hypothetical protein